MMAKLESTTGAVSPSAAVSRLPTRRYSRALLCAIFFATVFWYLVPQGSHVTLRSNRFESSAPTTHLDPSSQEAQTYWNTFSYTLTQARPPFGNITLKHSLGWLVYDINEPHERFDIASLNGSDFEELKELHKTVVRDVRGLSQSLPFKRGTRGIVAAVDNDGLTILTTSLRMLRIAGSTLPVEIFLPKYEQVPCEIIFPSLGARCVLLSDVLGERMTYPITVRHFGWKTAAVLFSSFEQILYLDSDLFPVEDPDRLFLEEPFVSVGHVLWPDYWSSTASPKFYELAGITMPNMSTRASSESGAFLLNKATHAATALLTFYYNQYGHGYFYELLSQGANGFGDKDTWLAATQVFDLPFYQVHEPPTRMGYRCGKQEHPLASAQHHPGEDWFNIQHGIRRGDKSLLRDAPEPRVIFVHGNLPKYDASYILDWHAPKLEWTDMLRCDNNSGEPHRLWGPKEFTVRKFGWDAEKSVWDSMRWTACEHEFDYVMWWNGTWHSKPQVNLCKRIVDWYNELLPTETYTTELSRPKRVSFDGESV